MAIMIQLFSSSAILVLLWWLLKSLREDLLNVTQFLSQVDGYNGPAILVSAASNLLSWTFLASPNRSLIAPQVLMGRSLQCFSTSLPICQRISLTLYSALYYTDNGSCVYNVSLSLSLFYYKLTIQCLCSIFTSAPHHYSYRKSRHPGLRSV